MANAPDAERLLALLRDPNVESGEVATALGVPREEAGRAARLVLGLARATPADVVSLPGPLAAAIARAALQAGRGDLLAALAGHAAKDVAKEAKRGLHGLRARGVAVPEPARPPGPALSPPAEEPAPPAYASSIDGRGERAVWIARNVAGKGVEVAQAIASDTRGLVELQVGMLGRKEWRQFARGLLERGATMAVAEIDREEAKAIVARARAMNETSGARLPDGADAWLRRLGPVAAAPRDPAERFPPLPPDEERDAVASSAKLHDLPLLGGWMADEDYLRGVAHRLDEIAVSPLYLDERQRAEAMARTVSDAVDGFFDDARRARFAARLFGAAEHLERRGDAAHARLAAATARALLSGAPAGAVPFARLLVEKAFPPAEPAAPPVARAPEPGPLIVAPR
jgi:hypothetical protein